MDEGWIDRQGITPALILQNLKCWYNTTDHPIPFGSANSRYHVPSEADSIKEIDRDWAKLSFWKKQKELSSEDDTVESTKAFTGLP